MERKVAIERTLILTAFLVSDNDRFLNSKDEEVLCFSPRASPHKMPGIPQFAKREAERSPHPKYII